MELGDVAVLPRRVLHRRRGIRDVLVTVIHTLWSRSLERSVAASNHRPTTTVYVDDLNLNIQVTESELRSLLAYMDRPAHPVDHSDPGDDDRVRSRLLTVGQGVQRPASPSRCNGRLLTCQA